jgi:hypothetical protein
MIIIGVDFHPEFPQIASVDSGTGEFQEKRLGHREEAEKFYRGLTAASQTVRVGMEASGHARWFERLVAELQFELWIGDAAEIRTRRVRTALIRVPAGIADAACHEMRKKDLALQATDETVCPTIAHQYALSVRRFRLSIP